MSLFLCAGVAVFVAIHFMRLDNAIDLKSDNLQYNMLALWLAGTNNSSTKRLMFQALFLHSFLQFFKALKTLYFYFD